MILGRKMIYLWRKLKFRIFTFYVLCTASICNQRFLNEFLSFKPILEHYKIIKFYELEDIFIYRKYLVVQFSDDWPSFPVLLYFVFSGAWFCEKFKVNLEFTSDSDAKGVETFFENYIDVKQYRKKHPSAHIKTRQNLKGVFGEISSALIGQYLVPPKSGHRTLLKLSIKPNLEKYADEYINLNTNEDWVAVHFRGTDVITEKHLRFRYVITLESYIVYLKEVLDNHCRIFACSDQAQFIDEMNVAFPGRVFARGIQRSINYETLHLGESNLQQKRDAFMDLLVLARAKLIYTTGSGFVDIVRFFNPKTKIVSLDGRKRSGNNYMPIPKKDLYDSLSRKKK